MKKNMTLWFVLAFIICLIGMFFTPLSKWIENAAITYLRNPIWTWVQNNVEVPIVTPGVTVQINTGNLISWDIIKSEAPRDFLDYIINFGDAWKDYLMVVPPKPPVIHSSDKEENNKIMYSYFDKNVIIFDIPDNWTTPYILIKTKKEVSDNRDLFLWLDWKSMWAIRKDKSLPVHD